MKLLLSVLALFLIAGCGHVFSESARREVDKSITFGELKSDPKLFIGKYVKLGGEIAGLKNTEEGSQLQVVQFKLGSDDIPDESSASGGRFLAITPEYLDSMIYKTGRLVAIIGQVRGSKTLPLDEMQYTYPLISIVEIHVWKKSEVYYYAPPYTYYPFVYPWPWYGPPYWYPYGYPFRYWR